MLVTESKASVSLNAFHMVTLRQRGSLETGLFWLALKHVWGSAYIQYDKQLLSHLKLSLTSDYIILSLNLLCNDRL